MSKTTDILKMQVADLIKESRELARLMMQDEPINDEIDYMSVGVRLAQLTLELERRENDDGEDERLDARDEHERAMNESE